MGFNFRIYLRSVKKVLFEDNPVVLALIMFIKLIDTYSEVRKRSKIISTSITETKLKFEETQKVINSSSKQNNFNSINLIR